MLPEKSLLRSDSVSMNYFTRSSIAQLVVIMVKLAPLRMLVTISLKGMFLVCQVSAVWIMISWVAGSVLPAAESVLGASTESWLYPVLAGTLLIFAAVCSCAGRAVSLTGIKKVEYFILNNTKSDQLLVGDFRNLTKLLLAVTDSLVPMCFILAVILAWVIVIPTLALPLAGLGLGILIFFRRSTKFSASQFKPGTRTASLKEYVGSDEHEKFYKILMLPQYIAVVSYTFMAVALVIVVISIRSLASSNIELGLLPIASAVAILQFRAFIGLLVKFGAYTRNAAKIASLINSIHN